MKKTELVYAYEKKKEDIKKALENFKSVTKEQAYFEFMFCLLTPQSKAQKCWQAVEQLKELRDWNQNAIISTLKTKTRFHNTKAVRILDSKQTWQLVKDIIYEKNFSPKELRNLLASKVKGYGLKEASHFLRNIGKSNNQIAILDRHILKNLKELNAIKEEKIKNQKHYLELEEQFIKFAQEIKIPIDELDLLFWSQENGEIFK